MGASVRVDTLELTTLLLCEESWSGAFFVAPVADPSLACRSDSLASALSEQRLYLEDYLAEADPEVVARFALPSNVHLIEVELEARRVNLPKRLPISGPIALSAIVVPLDKECWVFVPSLEHTIHVSARQNVEEVTRAECTRLIVAKELKPFEWLRLLPPRSTSLEPTTLSLKRLDLPGNERARSARRRRIESARRAEAIEILGSVGVPLHERPEAKRGPDLVGREAETEMLSALLSSRERQGVVLVGPELCGKSAVLFGWLRRERAAGRERRVYATSASRLIAGMSGFGQWQERVQRVVRAASELDAILCFDDLSDLLAQTSGEAMDIPGALRPFLEEGKVRLLGEATLETLGLLEARHPSFFGAFARVRVEPLDPAVTGEVLRHLIDWYAAREPALPNLEAGSVPTLLDLVERYLPYRALPGKAVHLYEELRAAHRDDREIGGKPRALTASDLFALFSLKTGIPEFLLHEDRALAAAEIERFFRARLVGQQEAIRAVVETLCAVKAGLQPQGKPLATFLFAGPTGVGKTELARALAAFLFGSAERMFRFDMSEYADGYAAERLIRGSDISEGLLTRRVRQQRSG